MENSNYNINNNQFIKINESSQLTINLRKKKLDEKLNEFHSKTESNL